MRKSNSAFRKGMKGKASTKHKQGNASRYGSLSPTKGGRSHPARSAGKGGSKSGRRG